MGWCSGFGRGRSFFPDWYRVSPDDFIESSALWSLPGSGSFWGSQFLIVRLPEMRSVRPASVPGFIHPFNSLSETNISLFYLMSQVICAEPEALNPPAMGQEGGGRVKFLEDAPGPCCTPLSPLASRVLRNKAGEKPQCKQVWGEIGGSPPRLGSSWDSLFYNTAAKASFSTVTNSPLRQPCSCFCPGRRNLGSSSRNRITQLEEPPKHIPWAFPNRRKDPLAHSEV